jgi:uncharacterized membrane protein
MAALDASQLSVRRPTLAVGVLTLCGLALRLVFINAQSLRLDESSSLFQARDALGKLWRYELVTNVHVPLYHTILHYWVRIAGSSEVALRIPSVAFGTCAIPLFYLVARRLVNPSVAVMAAAIGAASPFWVWHSDEARMYPLLLALTLASMLLLFKALEDGRFGWWALYALVTGLSLYSHYLALLMPPVHLAYLVVQRAPRRKIVAWFAAMIAVAVMFAPWAFNLYVQRLHPHGLASMTNGVSLRGDYSAFGIIYGMLYFGFVYIIGYTQSIGAGGWPLIILAGSLSHRFARWLRTRAAFFLFVWLSLTIGAVFLVNIWKPGLLEQRYLIIASPAIFLVLASVLSHLTRRRIWGLALVIALLGALTLYENVSVSNPVREDFRRAAALIQPTLQHDDVVVVLPGFYARPLAYYFGAHDQMVLGPSPEDTAETVVESEVFRLGALHRGKTMWVLIAYNDTFDPRGAIAGALDRRLVRISSVPLGGHMTLRHYQL